MASSAKYIRERRKGFGKIHYEKIGGQKTMKEKRRRRGCGKIHYEKMHSGQNTIKKKRHLGQNTMEKGAEVSAKYITKKCISGKIE